MANVDVAVTALLLFLPGWPWLGSRIVVKLLFDISPESVFRIRLLIHIATKEIYITDE